jgi:hypothetical protein
MEKLKNSILQKQLLDKRSLSTVFGGKAQDCFSACDTQTFENANGDCRTRMYDDCGNLFSDKTSSGACSN